MTMVRPIIFTLLLLGHPLIADNTTTFHDFAETDRAESETASLQGSDVESGGSSWETNGSIVLSSNNILSSNGTGSAWFPLYREVENLRAEATVRPTAAEWVSLAFGGDLGENYFRDAQLWVLVRETGIYQVGANGTELTIAEGSVPKFSPEGNEVELVYEKKRNAVTLRLNNVTILGRENLGGFHPALNSVGVRFHRVQATGEDRPALSNLEVAVSGMASPEVGITLPKLAVYEPGEVIRADLTVAGSPLAGGSVLVSLVDYFGKTVWEDSFGIPPASGSWSHDLQIIDPTLRGYLQLRLSLRDGNGEVLKKTATSLAVIPLPSPETRDDSNPFGGMVRPHRSYPFKEKELDARFMERIGMRYVRSHRFNFIHARPTESHPVNWEEMDRELELYERFGLRIVATTGWPIPNWASEAADLDTEQQKSLFYPSEAGLAATVEFAEEMANRYGDQIAFYQIGNEVDASSFWLGRVQNQKAHDIDAIIRDYFEYFQALSGAIRRGDPEALVAPSTTSRTSGHTYRPWLETMLRLGAGPLFGAFGTHYDADLNAALELFRDYDVAEDLPFILTEIGGMSRVPTGSDPFGNEMKRSIRTDYFQMISQLASRANVQAMCKFLLREESNYGHEGIIFAGLLTNDFEIRPSYASYANLIHHMAGAVFTGDLNVTTRSEKGWLRGLSFEKGGEPLHALFLNANRPCRVTLNTEDQSVVVVDVMGNLRNLPAEDGIVSFEMDPILPVFVLGQISGDPGNLQIPEKHLLSEKELSLGNGGFEEGIDGWRPMIDETTGSSTLSTTGFTVSIDSEIRTEGQQSIRFDATEPTRWYGVSQNLPLDEIPIPRKGEFLVFEVSLEAKGEQVDGKGLGFTLAFRDGDFTRFRFIGSPYFGFGGTFDWKPMREQVRIETWPEGTEQLSLDILMGLSTGTLWVDDIRVVVQHWREALSDSEIP